MSYTGGNIVPAKALDPNLGGQLTPNKVAPLPPDPAVYDRGPEKTVAMDDGAYMITITEYPYWPKGQKPTFGKPAN